jgi:hypothetical protein
MPVGYGGNGGAEGASCFLVVPVAHFTVLGDGGCGDDDALLRASRRALKPACSSARAAKCERIYDCIWWAPNMSAESIELLVQIGNSNPDSVRK